MDDSLYYVLGYVLILYGIFKMLFCMYHLIPSQYNQHRDHTLAGVFIFYVILVFAGFTLVKGAAWIGLIEMHLGLTFYVILNMVMGILIVVFYYLVIYTDVPISKDPTEYKDYEGYGLCTGIGFIASVPIIILIKGDIPLTSLYGIVLLLSAIGLIVLDVILFARSGHLANMYDIIITVSISVLNAMY